MARAPLLQLVGLTDADADELELALTTSSSPAVQAEIERQLDYLAVTLRNAINIFNPQLVILGGFLGSFMRLPRPSWTRSWPTSRFWRHRRVSPSVAPSSRPICS